MTSTNKDGLEKAVAMINDLMQKELPNLVDERRFRRREPEQQVERDEYGRVRDYSFPLGLVSIIIWLTSYSANGRMSVSPSILSLSLVSTCALRSSDRAVLM